MENVQCFKKVKQEDKEVRDTFIKENTGLVWSVVKRFTNRGYDQEELFQIGCIGLIKAVDRFDEKYEVAFSTYAVPLITGELKRFFRDNGIIRVSRSLKEAGWKIKQEQDRFYEETGKSPTIEELAELVHMSKEEIVMAMDANAQIESIDQKIDFGEGKTVSMLDQVVAKEQGVGAVGCQDSKDIEKEQLINKMLVHSVMKKLDEREKRLITMRFFGDKTQNEVAKTLGISQVQVSRLEKKILRQMRTEILGTGA